MHSINISQNLKLISIIAFILITGCLKPAWKGKYSPIYHIPYEVKWDRINVDEAGDWLDITYAEYAIYVSNNSKRYFEQPKVYFEIPTNHERADYDSFVYGPFEDGIALGFSSTNNMIHVYDPLCIAHEFGHIIEYQTTGDSKPNHDWTPEIKEIISRLELWDIYKWK